MIYQHIPELVKVIIWEGEQFQRCMARNETYFEFPEEEKHSPGSWQTGKKGCMMKEGFESGIPIWKSFTFHFWRDAQHPLGGPWTLAPYDYAAVSDSKNYYLGQ